MSSPHIAGLCHPPRWILFLLSFGPLNSMCWFLRFFPAAVLLWLILSRPWFMVWEAGLYLLYRSKALGVFSSSSCSFSPIFIQRSFKILKYYFLHCFSRNTALCAASRCADRATSAFSPALQAGRPAWPIGGFQQENPPANPHRLWNQSSLLLFFLENKACWVPNPLLLP